MWGALSLFKLGALTWRSAAQARGHLLCVWLSVEDFEESLDGASLLSSLRALLTHFLFLFRCWQRWKVIHYLVENILTFAGRQVAEIVRRRQLHESVENRRFFSFLLRENQTVWGLPALENLLVDLVLNLNSSVFVCLCRNTSSGFHRTSPVAFLE